MTIALSRFNEVRLNRVSRDFGALNALRDLSLNIRRGEFIACPGLWVEDARTAEGGDRPEGRRGVVFAAGERAVQSIDAMAAIYMDTTLVWLIIALCFVNSTQIVTRATQQPAH